MIAKVFSTFDLVQLLTDYLSVKDATVLTGVRSFYYDHFDESFWKEKVRKDYGINDKFRNRSWKNMARYFYENDMVNLGKRWVNGMKYEEMISEFEKIEDEKMKGEYFKKRLSKAIINAIDSKEIVKHKRDFCPWMGISKGAMLHIIGREIEDSELISLKKICTRELSIIFSSCEMTMNQNIFRNIISHIVIHYCGAYVSVCKQFDDDLFIPRCVNSHDALCDMIDKVSLFSNDLPRFLPNLIVFNSFSNNELDQFTLQISPSN